MSDGAIGEHPLGGMDEDNGGGGGPDYVLSLSAASDVFISPIDVTLFTDVPPLAFHITLDAAASVVIAGGTMLLFTDAPTNNFTLVLDSAAAVTITSTIDLTLYWSVAHINLDAPPDVTITTFPMGALLPVPPIEITLTEHMVLTDTITPRVSWTASETLNISQTQTIDTIWQLAEQLMIAGVQLPTTTYNVGLSEHLMLVDLFRNTSDLVLSETLNLTATMSVVRAVQLLEHLMIAPVMTGSGVYGETLLEAIRLSQPLQDFLGAEDLAETLNVTDTIRAQHKMGAILTEELNLSMTQVPTLLISGVLSEELELAASDVLSMIFNGQLDETLELNSAYISPGGTVATWVMNTRNSAVTEYANYAFNSFAQMGRKFLGANRDGLYELDGPTDAGTDIVWTIKSGNAKFNGQRLTGFKAVYLGLKGEGDYVLRMETLNGEKIGYKIRAHDGAITKIPVGKGLRATYWSFELTGIGARSELDTVEFVPMRANRRV